MLVQVAVVRVVFLPRCANTMMFTSFAMKNKFLLHLPSVDSLTFIDVSLFYYCNIIFKMLKFQWRANEKYVSHPMTIAHDVLSNMFAIPVGYFESSSSGIKVSRRNYLVED